MAKIDYASSIWSLTRKLRRQYDKAQYARVILPFTLLRYLECTLRETKPKVLKLVAKKNLVGKIRVEKLKQAAGFDFYNSSSLDLESAIEDPDLARKQLQSYLNGFSSNIRDVFNGYDFVNEITRLDDADLLIPITRQFLEWDFSSKALSPEKVAAVFDELVSRCLNESLGTASWNHTPADVAKLAATLLLSRDQQDLEISDVKKDIYDPVAGIGAMLDQAKSYLGNLNKTASFTAVGQESDELAWSIVQSALLIRGEDPENFDFGNSLTEDTRSDSQFDYAITNLPIQSRWSEYRSEIIKERKELGFQGRFGAGLPSTTDAALLYVMHLVSKMKPAASGGSRAAIILNESPLVSGSSASGESAIRRWLLEQDLIELVVLLPKSLTFNNPDHSYLVVLDNDKPRRRKNKAQLIDAKNLSRPLFPAVEQKKRFLTDSNIASILKTYESFEANAQSKILSPEDFGYRNIVVDRPLLQSWVITKDKLVSLSKQRSFKKLNAELALEKIEALGKNWREKKYQDRALFIAQLEALLTDLNKLSTAQLVKLLDHFAEIDEKGAPAKDQNGNLVADETLRQKLKVPILASHDQYLSWQSGLDPRNFWIEKIDDKVGFEISFASQFAKPPKDPFVWPKVSLPEFPAIKLSLAKAPAENPAVVSKEPAEQSPTEIAIDEIAQEQTAVASELASEQEISPEPLEVQEPFETVERVSVEEPVEAEEPVAVEVELVAAVEPESELPSWLTLEEINLVEIEVDQKSNELSPVAFASTRFARSANPLLSELPAWLSDGLESESESWQQSLVEQQLASLNSNESANIQQLSQETETSMVEEVSDSKSVVPEIANDPEYWARLEDALLAGDTVDASEPSQLLPSWLSPEPTAEYLAGLPSWLSLRQEPELVASSSLRKTGPRQVLGEGLVTVGMTMVLFLFWYLVLNDAIQSGTQREAASGLSRSWSDFIPLPGISPSVPATQPTDIEPPRVNPGAEGQVFALLYVPRFGEDYVRKIGEGIDLDRVLNSRTIGVGRYPQSDPLGAYGNFAVAGHRNTWGAAFGEIGELRLGDRIYVEVKEGWYSYQFRNLEYVWSSETDVLNAFPRLSDQPADARIITLTSCHPKFSEAERIIAYGVYEGWYPRENGPPQEIAEQVNGAN